MRCSVRTTEAGGAAHTRLLCHGSCVEDAVCVVGAETEAGDGGAEQQAWALVPVVWEVCCQAYVINADAAQIGS